MFKNNEVFFNNESHNICILFSSLYLFKNSVYFIIQNLKSYSDFNNMEQLISFSI